MRNHSSHLKNIQLDIVSLQVGERYLFQSKRGIYHKDPPFSATVESYSVARTNWDTSERYIVLKDRYQLMPYQSMEGSLSTPISWVHASTLDILCLPEEISRLILSGRGCS